MEDKTKLKVRDLRRKGYFSIDNEFVDWYLPIFTDSAIRVYITLCKMADKDGVCFPKQTTLAEKTNRSRQTINEAIKQLEEYNLIEVENIFDDYNRQLSNNYTLLDKQVWIIPKKQSEADKLDTSVKPSLHPLSSGDDTLHIYNKTQFKKENFFSNSEIPIPDENLTSWKELKSRGRERRGRGLANRPNFTPSWQKKEEDTRDVPPEIRRMIDFAFQLKEKEKNDGS